MADKTGMWSFIGSIDEVPTDCDLHLAVVDEHELHALVFPCRRLGSFGSTPKRGGQ